MPTLTERISQAFALFDQGHLAQARAAYHACLRDTAKDDNRNLYAIHMGLAYVESALRSFGAARQHCKRMLACARGVQERHIAIHQAGMVERLAGCYPQALALFAEEHSLLVRHCPDSPLAFSTNLYEQAYTRYKLNRPGEAKAQTQEALTLALAAKDSICIGCAHCGLGEIEAASGRAESAATRFTSAIRAFEDGRDHIAADEARELLARLS